ncbi:MAG TPA: hypothetical protein VGR73_17795 [Bryobacteraceae bacterium]|nr:hypothetical protein [Bryobacteraceae bacterium]
MKFKLFLPACLLVLPAAAQTDLSTYQGPGVLSPGVGDVGTRSGQQVDLRLWGGVSAVYDTNLQPLITDSKGNLIHVPNLYGVEANIGAYGVHSWQHAELGLSYVGAFHHYTTESFYDGTDQALNLGYTVQYSSRVTFDIRGTGSTLSRSAGSVASALTSSGNPSAVPLFDSRTSMVDVSGSMTFTQSPRTFYTFGAGADSFNYRADVLTSYSGYNVTGSALHRLSLSTTVGGVYTYAQLSSGSAFGMRTHTLAGQYIATFGRVWSFNLTAGATLSQLDQTVVINGFLPGPNGLIPVTFPVPLALHSVYPSGTAELRRQFQRASASVSYTRAVGGGNGFFLGARSQSAGAAISYTGVRKWNFGIDGSYQSFVNLGPNSSRSASYGGGSGVTYEMVHSLHLVGRYDIGHYDFASSGFQRTTQRATLGLTFSPGSVPLSLW